MSTLYELTNELNGLNYLVDNGDLTVDDVADTVEALNLEFEDKVKGCLMARQNLVGKCAAIESELSRLTALAKSKNNQIDSISEYIKSNMIETGTNKLDLGIFVVTIKKASKKLGDIDEDKIPSRYFKVIPESKKLDKRALLSDAKKEDIEGVELADSERGMTIK